MLVDSKHTFGPALFFSAKHPFGLETCRNKRSFLCPYCSLRFSAGQCQTKSRLSYSGCALNFGAGPDVRIELPFAETPQQLNAIAVTCYMTSSEVVDFQCALNFGEAQSWRASRCQNCQVQL